MKKSSAIYAVVIMILAASGNSASEAQADMIVFTNGALWENQVGSFVMEDFNNEPLRALALGSNAFNGFSIDIADVGIDNGNEIAVGTNPRNIDSTKFALLNFTTDQSYVSVSSLTFDSEITAFGADWASTTNYGGLTLTVTINGDTLRFIDYLGTPGDGFLGFVSDVPFTRVDFGLSGSINNEAFGMDNAASAPVPEPATMSLLAIGGLTLLWRRRK